MTWQERFGHANVDYILKTSRLDAVRGLPKLKKPLNFECEPCRLNKYKKVSFQSKECTRSKVPLNLLHCDVWGPANVIGKRGEKAERQVGLKVKAVHSDIGGEFIAGILNDFFVEIGTRGYRVRIPEDSKVIETPNVRFQKPQQSNKEAVLASPGLKFSDYELVENGNDVDEDETVNNIPVSLRKNSETENEVGKALIVP
ncbi:uncharacterized protein TNCV_4943551 [Trichonephila clavipes]|nr:uncharacterized protein TNCV_4943551 [Trichonephila clavipes]